MAVYRPPAVRGHPIGEFVEDFLEKWAEVNVTHDKVIILGDFNIHMNEDDPDAMAFKADLDVIGLRQWVSFATHQQGHMLDLIMTNSDSHLNVMAPTAGDYLSDHRFIHSVIQIKKPVREVLTKTITKLDEIDIYDLRKEADLGLLYTMDNIDDMIEMLGSECHQSY